jgi:glycogen phosphorylase
VRGRDLLAAYFSMEVGMYPELKTYSGGLGILAGDYLKSAADLRIPISAVTNLYNFGYFDQRIEGNRQREEYSRLDPIEYMTQLPYTVQIEIEGRKVKVGCARMYYNGVTNFLQPQYFLFTAGNGHDGHPWDDEITSSLYKKGVDDQNYWRIAQEQVLGIAGVEMLHILAEHGEIRLPKNYHFNEGHAQFALLDLVKRYGFGETKAKSVFTTHTPVEAGHDVFDYGKLYAMLGESFLNGIDMRAIGGQFSYNMTRASLNMTRYANAVAQRHGVVSRKMFPEYNIDSITNGVHSNTWTAKVFKKLFDEYFNEFHYKSHWTMDPSILIDIDKIPDETILQAHSVTKSTLLDYIKKKTGDVLDEDVLTIGFARRFATYKRGDLIFSDLDRLMAATDNGKVQFIFSGKAHPNDELGKNIISSVIDNAAKLKDKIKVVFLPNYEMDKAKLLVSGVDVWLNLPRRPWEASGTSGMKGGHNGVPSFSTIDGWWDEVPKEANGERRGGWSIGSEPTDDDLKNPVSDKADFESFCTRLQDDVLPAFKNPKEWSRIMKGAIKNASYFNTHRMVKEYVEKAYGERLEDVVVK